MKGILLQMTSLGQNGCGHFDFIFVQWNEMEMCRLSTDINIHMDTNTQ